MVLGLKPGLQYSRISGHSLQTQTQTQAQAQAILAGDVIVAINGHTVQGMDFKDVVKVLRGERVGSEVRLVLERGRGRL